MKLPRLHKAERLYQMPFGWMTNRQRELWYEFCRREEFRRNAYSMERQRLFGRGFTL